MNVAFKQPTKSTARSMPSPRRCCCRSGIDGVYARTALFEEVVDGLGGSDLASPRAGHRSAAFSAGDEPPAVGEIRLSEKLSAFSRLRVLPAGERTRHPRGGRPLRCRRGLDDVAVAGRSRADARPPAIRSIRSSRAAARCPPAACCFDVAGDCFRREPSTDLDRLQSFRMREYVCIGTPEQIDDFRDRWMVRAQGIAGGLG